MSRWIDADAFIISVVKSGFGAEFINKVTALLINTPTIEPKQKWISCKERLPNESEEYLVCPSNKELEAWSELSEVMIIPYDADCEAFGWWTDQYDPITFGYVDSDFNDIDVLAWMPLPTTYKEGV